MIERSSRRFVLVTGMPRSGTTPVGNILAAARGAAYLYEPLNKVSGLREVPHYFQGPLALEHRHAFIDAQLGSIYTLRMSLGRGVFSADAGLRRAIKQVVGSRTRWSFVRTRVDPRVRTIIWKDPFAALLVPYISRYWTLPTVVTVRPAAAVAASFKRLAWRFDVVRIRADVARVAPKVVDGLSHADSLRFRDDPVTNAAVLWRLVYGYLAEVGGRASNVGWIDMERLVKQPLEIYPTIYSLAGLAYDAHVRQAIESQYQDKGRNEPAIGRAHDRRRNVRQANEYWRSVLTTEEAERVRDITDPARASVAALLKSDN